MQTIVWVPLLALAVFLIVGNGGRLWALVVLPLLSLVAIPLVWDWGTLLATLVLIIPCFVIRETLPNRLATWWRPVAVGLTLVLFVMLKDYFGVASSLFSLSETDGNTGTLKPLLAAVGLSFVVFRTIEYAAVSDVSAPAYLEKFLRFGWVARFWNYLGFCLSFTSFSSGPILRWSILKRDWLNDGPIFKNRSDMMAVWTRTANALLAFALLSQPLALFMTSSSTLLSNLVNKGALQAGGMAFMMAVAIIYLYFLYVNFAAFSAVMIASGRLMGLTVPENFDRPFASTGFLDFWNRWHLSVSLWFRDNLFTPMMRWLVMIGVKSNTVCLVLVFSVVFGLLGLWHGRTWPFLLCGFLLAVGAIVNQFYRDKYRKRVNKRLGKSGFKRRVFDQWLRAFAFLYIALAVLGLWAPGELVTAFWQSLADLHFALTILAITTGYALILELIDTASAALIGPVSFLNSCWQTNEWLGISVKLTLSIAAFWLFAYGQQQLIYEGF